MRRLLAILAPLLGFLLFAPLASAAQTPPSWFGGLYYEGDTFSGSSPDWTDWRTVRAVAIRRFEHLSVGAEVGSTRRFGLTDQAVAGDLYLDLREGTYLNIRGRGVADAEILPRADLRAELFQNLAGGWEVSGNLRFMNVAGPDVGIAGLGVAKYYGQWFLQSRVSLARIEGEHAPSASLSARRILEDDGRQYFEFGGGVGKEVVLLGGGPILEARSTRFLAASHQRFFLNRLGIHIGAGASDFEGVPLRRTLTAGLIARF